MEPHGQDGVLPAHGQRGAVQSSIYVTPAKGLASHPVYSRFFPLCDENYGQVVLALRIDPDAVASTQESTLGGRQHWPRELRIDPAFHNHDGLEWLLHDAEKTAIVAVLLRCFGPKAGPYGSLIIKPLKITESELPIGSCEHCRQGCQPIACLR